MIKTIRYDISDMVSVCTKESDPRPNVSSFVSDDSVKSIVGLKAEGLSSLMKIIEDEIVLQHPGASVAIVDREMMSDNGICFSDELRKYIMDHPSVTYYMIAGEIPLNDWQKAFENLPADVNISVFYASLGCGHVPLCVKII